MQNCWSTCQPDISIETSPNQKGLPPCQFCFEPSNQVIMTDIFNMNRDRQYSEPVCVPDSLIPKLINSQEQGEQAHSSGYESTFGNGLSPTTNSWTSGKFLLLLLLIYRFCFQNKGVNDVTSCPSITSDEQDRSISDDTSTTGVPDEDQSNLDDDHDDDDDDDSFEVLSFEAPPESTIYIKGIDSSLVGFFSFAKINLFHNLEFQFTTADSQNNICVCCNVLFTSISNVAPRRCYYYWKIILFTMSYYGSCTYTSKNN